MSAPYLLPTTPPDAIMLTLGYKGLFPPALGTTGYSMCGKGLLELLQHLVPSTLSPAFNAILSTVHLETANGYDLLWRMLRLYVPGFDKAKPIIFPYWSESINLFVFAKLTMMYFRLQQLHKAPFSDYNKSITFLTGLAGSDYSDQVNTLITTVENYNLDDTWTNSGEAGLIPKHLRIPALASQLNQFAQRRISHSLVPYVNRLNFNYRYPESIPLHLHPTLPAAFHVNNNNSDQSQRGRHYNNSDHSPRGRHYNQDRPPQRDTPYPSPPSRVQFSPPSQKPLPNPWSTCQPFINTQCPACGRVGHTTQTCDMLAMAISLKRYMDQQISTNLMAKIESDWLTRYRDKLKQTDSRTPRQVLQTYTEDYDLTVANINSQIDWTAWDYELLTNLTTVTGRTDNE